MLRKHEHSLRAIYDGARSIKGFKLDAGLANKIVSYSDWMEFMKRFNLIADDCTERDATLCFVWSRMRTIDEENAKSRLKMQHLAFEDFLEAICRLSGLLALPTDDDLSDFGHPHAGAFLLTMRNDNPEEYDKFVHLRQGAWGRPSWSDARKGTAGMLEQSSYWQPIERCIEHTIHLLIYIVQGGVGSYAPTMEVSPKEVHAFLGTVMREDAPKSPKDAAKAQKGAKEVVVKEGESVTGLAARASEEPSANV